MIQEKVDILISLVKQCKYNSIENLYPIVDAIWLKLKQGEGKHLFYLNPYYFNNDEN